MILLRCSRPRSVGGGMYRHCGYAHDRESFNKTPPRARDRSLSCSCARALVRSCARALVRSCARALVRSCARALPFNFPSDVRSPGIRNSASTERKYRTTSSCEPATAWCHLPIALCTTESTGRVEMAPAVIENPGSSVSTRFASDSKAAPGDRPSSPAAVELDEGAALP